MAINQLIAGNWGTSHLVLMHLVADDSASGGFQIKTIASGAGASKVGRGNFPDTLSKSVSELEVEKGDIPTLLCGMVGSTIGWEDAGYSKVPTALAALKPHIVADSSSNIFILPGLSCTNLLGEPDVMRGEETELVGWLSTDPAHGQGEHIVCIPGTHTKWVHVKDGDVASFLTGFSGELFGLLKDHSILIGGSSAAESKGEASLDFLQYLPSSAGDTPSLQHLLFSVRARVVSKQGAADQAAQHLSALVIGSDILGAAKIFGASLFSDTIHIIGAPELTARYAAAMRHYDFGVSEWYASEMSARGLWSAATRIF